MINMRLFSRSFSRQHEFDYRLTEMELIDSVIADIADDIDEHISSSLFVNEQQSSIRSFHTFFFLLFMSIRFYSDLCAIVN